MNPRTVFRMATYANAFISSAIFANHRLVPKFVFCSVEQGHQAFPEGLQKQCKLLRTALKLRMVATLELLPFGRIVAEALALLCAWCNISQPQIYFGAHLVKPRGQRRSTRMRSPSSASGSS